MYLNFPSLLRNRLKNRLKKDVLGFGEKGTVVLLGDFNGRVGRSVDVDDVVGILGEDTHNASGNRISCMLW